MLEYRIATKEDIELLMSTRLFMLREVNNLDEDYQYSDVLIDSSRKYFLEGDQTTVLALDDGKPVGCASMSYFTVMPTFSHVSGKRAHLMNVFTDKNYRRMGIGKTMVNMLIEDAWNKGATEISLDATESGRPLYKALGFNENGACMNMTR